MKWLREGKVESTFNHLIELRVAGRTPPVNDRVMIKAIQREKLPENRNAVRSTEINR